MSRLAIASQGATVLIDPEQPLQVEVSVGEAPQLPETHRWLAVGIVAIEGRRVWVYGRGPSRDEALQDLIRAGTELRVGERKRVRARQN